MSHYFISPTGRKYIYVNCGPNNSATTKKEYANGGYSLEHRKIMEDYLGRKLSRNEVVHHKNGITTDNRLDNLELMSRGKHISIHKKGKGKLAGFLDRFIELYGCGWSCAQIADEYLCSAGGVVKMLRKHIPLRPVGFQCRA